MVEGGKEEQVITIPVDQIWRFIAWRMRHALRINMQALQEVRGGRLSAQQLADTLKGVSLDLELMFGIGLEMTKQDDVDLKDAESRFLMDVIEQSFRASLEKAQSPIVQARSPILLPPGVESMN